MRVKTGYIPNLNFSIDLHCHSNYKTFARAHKASGQLPFAQVVSLSNNSSLWYYNPPNKTDKLANYFLGITKQDSALPEQASLETNSVNRRNA